MAQNLFNQVSKSLIMTAWAVLATIQNAKMSKWLSSPSRLDIKVPKSSPIIEPFGQQSAEITVITEPFGHHSAKTSVITEPFGQQSPEITVITKPFVHQSPQNIP